MGIFVDYLSNRFPAIADTPTTIIDTSITLHPVWVQSIIVTNIGTDDIRVNLDYVRTIEGTPSSMLIIKDLLIPTARQPGVYTEIKAINTVDLADFLGSKKNLQYGLTITDKLVCYSSGYTEIFNCYVDYEQLNELPL